MAKPLAASKKMMKNYLAELLTEDTIEAKKTLDKDKKLEKLLKDVTARLDVEDINSTITSGKSQARNKDEIEQSVSSLKVKIESKEPNKHNYRENSFQVMYFDVAGLIVAVPLIQLGGIHNLEKVTPLLGKPDWFDGVMLHREDKVSVVNTALWVMPEKYDKNLNDSLNYQYVIMLNNSKWGLLAEHLVDTVTLSPDDVKWVDAKDKRPWLAGLVKNKMCALLDVEALIQLLDEGASVNQSN